MEIDDRLTIATPEGVDLSLTLAGVGSRFVAAIIDLIIEIGLIVAVAIAAGSLAEARSGWGGAMVALLSFVIVVCYDVFFEVLQSGRTPGKRMNGLRVVQTGGEPVTFVPSAIRNVLRIVDFLPTMYLTGIVAIVVTRRNQRIGDLVGGTLVVRERFAAERARPPVVTTAPLDAPAAVALDTSALSVEELTAVRRYLDRRYEIDASARTRIAGSLLARLRPKIAGVPDGLSGERLLEAIASSRAQDGRGAGVDDRAAR
jgi:uncharacterized RDD family membrane protein YckC